MLNLANKVIVKREPWALQKDPQKRPILESVLYALLETLRISAILIYPAMPSTATKLLGALGLDTGEELSLENAHHFGRLEPGIETSKVPALFPRLDRGKVEKALEDSSRDKKAEKKKEGGKAPSRKK